MAKNLILLLFTVHFLATSSFCQDTGKDTKKDSTKKDSTKWIDPKALDKIFKSQFSNLINGQSTARAGSNFAAVDITKAQLSFNGFLDFAHSNLSINVNGAVSDGFAALFTNSRLNTNVGIELKYNMLLPYNSITYTSVSLVERDDALNESFLALDLGLKNIATDSTLLETQISLLKNRIERLKLEKPSTEQANLENTEALMITTKKLDSLTYVRLLVAKKLKDQRTRLKKAFTNRADSIKFNAPDIQGFSIKWIALVGNVQNKSFHLFDPTRTYAQQVTKDNYVSKTAGIEFNLYKWDARSFRTFYFNIGVTGSIDNNLDNLTTMDLTEKTNYTDVTDQRTSSKTYSAYTGTYQSGIKKARFYSEFYWFLFPQNMAALHLFPEAIAQEAQKPLYNIGTGFVFTFKDKKDKDGKSVINAELYYKFTDVSNSLSSTLTLLQRNEVGLRFGLPINTFNKNK